ncbi:MAG: hypothetical protein ACLTYN_07700 [Dysosmobacter welbionis]
MLAAALAVTSLAACEQRLLTAEEAMDALEESIEVREYDIGPGELEYCISFRLPEHSGPEEEWNLHIAGRAETEALGESASTTLTGRTGRRKRPMASICRRDRRRISPS